MTSSGFWSAPPPQTYRALVTLQQTRLEASIAEGHYVPYVYPYRFLGFYLVICYFLLPLPRTQAQSTLIHYAKYPVFATYVYTCISAMRECRSSAVVVGYGIGLLHAFGILYVAAIMIFNDARRDFKRAVRVEGEKGKGQEEDSGETTLRDYWNENGNGQLNGDALHTRRHHKSLVSAGNRDIPVQETRNSMSTASKTPQYTWQALPSALSARFLWTMDLLTNLRGLGWTYRISTVPAPPLSLPSPTTKTNTTPASPTGNVRHYTRTSLLRSSLQTFTLSSVALDILKVVMMHDTYFWGYVDVDPPAPAYLPTKIATSPPLLRTYRLFLCLAGCYSALNTIFALIPLLLVGVLGPRFLGPYFTAPWQYPSYFGAYENVFAKGLRGWWGGWWHQTFRFAFEAPTVWALEKLRWEKRSLKAKALGLAVAFGCSGCLHACASWTTWGETRPVRGPGLFFVLQGVGILGEMGMEKGIRRIIGAKWERRVPGWAKRWGRFAAVHIWFYYTAGLICDDFSRSGIWLFEPVPVSLVRGMGWGLDGEGWWCWHGPLVGWWWGDRWWQSGLSF